MTAEYSFDNLRTPESAEEFFTAQMRWKFIESEMAEIVFDVFGCPDDNDYWFFTDVSFDDYDYSFELHRVELHWSPKEEQLKKMFDFGFKKCWINYVDGTEMFCHKFADEIIIGDRKQKV